MTDNGENSAEGDALVSAIVDEYLAAFLDRGHCLHPHPGDPGSWCCCRCERRSASFPGMTSGVIFCHACTEDGEGGRIRRAWRHHTEAWMLRGWPTPLSARPPFDGHGGMGGIS